MSIEIKHIIKHKFLSEEIKSVGLFGGFYNGTKISENKEGHLVISGKFDDLYIYHGFSLDKLYKDKTPIKLTESEHKYLKKNTPEFTVVDYVINSSTNTFTIELKEYFKIYSINK